jgi:hypothetical protein
LDASALKEKITPWLLKEGGQYEDEGCSPFLARGTNHSIKIS